ncbi:MAG: DNA methyltransferase [Pseudomonadales bacterium]
MASNLRQHNLTPRLIPIDGLRPLGRETRTHSPHQIDKIIRSLENFGVVHPIILDEHGRVVAGWGVVLAAQRHLLTHVPAITLSGLTEAQFRMLRLALNRIPEEAPWNPAELKLELAAILELDLTVDLTMTGFEMAEIDLTLQSETVAEEPAAHPPDRTIPAISRPGDLWLLGPHRMYCADALDQSRYDLLLGDERAHAVHSDPPYNLKIEGQVSGKGRVTHGEFAMASGEMSSAAFIEFLSTVMRHMVAYSVDGALHYLWMDWRHLLELLIAAQGIYTEQKNLCAWTKTNAGMGSLYRSQHELVAVFKHGTAPHINNVELGRYGRNRTNVWPYPGANTFRAGRLDDLADHPTVKPMRMIADAILDSTHAGDVVLDPFLGSGTTILACETTGRRGRGMELDPYYVDVAIRRWQALTGETARHAETGVSFDAMAEARETGPNHAIQETPDDQ